MKTAIAVGLWLLNSTTATLLGPATAMAAAAQMQAEAVLDAPGVNGGLVVHVGCGDGNLTAALRADDKYVVQGLDVDVGKVTAARKRLAAQGVYGPVSVRVFDGKQLPYADNLINLVVCDKLGDVPMSEVMRVLAPLGVAYVNGRKIIKPWPAEVDEWTHWLHSPDNNAVSSGRLSDIPRALQWIGGPLWLKSHELSAALSAMVTAQGRLFYIFDASAPMRKVISRCDTVRR